MRQAGYEPGAVLPSTLAALAAVDEDEPSLVVNRNGGSITTAIVHKNELLLHRTLELTGKEGLPDEYGHHSTEELQQSVSVAVSYFEDTLTRPPSYLLSCGPGGAEELAQQLGDFNVLKSARPISPRRARPLPL